MNRCTRLLLPTAASPCSRARRLHHHAARPACRPPNVPDNLGGHPPDHRRAGARHLLAASPGREAGRVSGYWAPSRQQIDQLEAQLSSLQAQVPKVLDFDRQYVGIESAGKRLIYVNAFHLPDGGINPAREAIRVCDGGTQFWGAVFDPPAIPSASCSSTAASAGPEGALPMGIRLPTWV